MILKPNSNICIDTSIESVATDIVPRQLTQVTGPIIIADQQQATYS
jgi:hypothetical protein